MRCQRCGFSNPDERLRCSFCGAVLTGQYVGKQRMSKLAMVSLLLTPGAYILAYLLTYLYPTFSVIGTTLIFLSIPVAFFLAVIALTHIRQSRGRVTGIGWALSGLLVVVLSTGLTQINLLQEHEKSVKHARMNCASNQRNIATAAALYIEEHGEYPSSMIPLRRYVQPETLICPSDLTLSTIGYGYNMHLYHLKAKSMLDPLNTFLIADGGDAAHRIYRLEDIDRTRHNGGYIVSFCDGHTEFRKAKENIPSK